MSTQTSEQTVPAPAAEPTHHFILTLQNQVRAGSLRVVTFQNAITPPTGWTRQQVYKTLYGQLTEEHPELQGAQTLFFSLEPNQL
jgi:hypothetical protein